MKLILIGRLQMTSQPQKGEGICDDCTTGSVLKSVAINEGLSKIALRNLRMTSILLNSSMPISFKPDTSNSYLMSVCVKVLEVIRGSSASTDCVQHLADRGEAESATFPQHRRDAKNENNQIVSFFTTSIQIS